MILFERIAKEVNEHVSSDWGSRAHVDRVWNAMWEKTCFHWQGLKVKLCRWWSFFDALEDLRHQWNVRRLVQMYIGMLDGWRAAEDLHEETPCLREFHDEPDDAVDLARPAHGEGAPSREASPTAMKTLGSLELPPRTRCTSLR